MMKTILTFSILFAPLAMWSQTKSLVASGGNIEQQKYSLSASIGQAFVNQEDDLYSFSEGFQQYILLPIQVEEYPKISISPNPTAHHIRLESQKKISVVQLRDAKGAIVETIYPVEKEVLISVVDLPSGVYFVHCTTDNKNTNIQKIIKL